MTERKESFWEWYWRTQFVEPAKNPVFWVIFVFLLILFWMVKVL